MDKANSSIAVSEAVDFAVDYSGFWGDEGSIKGSFSINEADAEDGIASLDELISWSWNWTGNSDAAAFSLSSDEGSVSALLPPGGFLLDGSNTPFDDLGNDADGYDQGLFEADSGDQILDLGALVVEDFAAGTFAEGDPTLAGTSISVSGVVDYAVAYRGFWGDEGSIRGVFSISEADAADGIASLDELLSWNFNWSGNADVGAFSLSSDEGSVTALLPPGGFLLDGQNTPFDDLGNDADGYDQGLYEADSGDQILDLGAALVEDFAAGTFAEGDPTIAGTSISVSEVLDIDVEYVGFWGNEGSVMGGFSISEADAADGVASLDELISWSWDWTGNSDVAAFSVSSDEGSATALLPPGGFNLTASNTAFDANFEDPDGLDQGLYESASGEQLIDLGALLIEDFAAGTFTYGDATAASGSISLSNNFSDDLVIGLYDSETDELIQVLEEGGSVSADGLDFDNLNIGAFVVEDGDLAGKVGSMQVLLDGEVGADFFENVEPYALFGDTLGDFFAGTLNSGEQTVSFKVYAEEQGEGDLLATVDRTFTIEESTPSDDLIIGLYNSETNQLVQVLEEGDSLAASSLDLDNLNIAAFVAEDGGLFGKVGSMQVLINGDTGTDYFENVEPYALFGDHSGDYLQGSLSAGDNTVAFEVYSEKMGGGDLVATVERSFTLA